MKKSIRTFASSDHRSINFLARGQRALEVGGTNDFRMVYSCLGDSVTDLSWLAMLS